MKWFPITVLILQAVIWASRLGGMRNEEFKNTDDFQNACLLTLAVMALNILAIWSLSK